MGGRGRTVVAGSLVLFQSSKMAGAVVKLGNLVKAGVDAGIPKAVTFLKYAKVELVPPGPAQIPQAIGQLSQVVKSGMTGKFLNLTVREAWINTLVGAEIVVWFFMGEIIGKGAIVGYQV